jgi:uncharacterized membrane protein YkvI
MLKKWGEIMRVAFTYMGTIVGAGFASGQEILQFFTHYGAIAVYTILIATLLFLWIGIKLMTISYDIKAKSYEDVNKLVFGRRSGSIFSTFMLIILFGVSSVMLAGSGSLFAEQLHLSYQTGLLVTLLIAYLIISRGMSAIMTVNTFVVPIMISFTCLIVWYTSQLPSAHNWLQLSSDDSPFRIWTSPLLYAAFNLTSSQAVLVPMGATLHSKSSAFWGGLLGAAGIGMLLLGAHYALSAQMPGIRQFDIPMGQLINGLGSMIQILYILVIYGEIFTTFIADVYGLTLQLEGRTGWRRSTILILVLGLCFAISQIGFKSLLSSLYPLFGAFSLIWLILIIWRRRAV